MSRKSAASAKPIRKAGATLKEPEAPKKKKKKINPKTDIEYTTVTSRHKSSFFAGVVIMALVVGVVIYCACTGFLDTLKM